MNCAESLSSQLGVWRMSSCMRPTRRMSLLMSLAYITMCVRWFFCKDFELVVDYGMSVRSVDVRACICSSRVVM